MLCALIGLQAALWFSKSGQRNLIQLEQDVLSQTLENSELKLRNQTLEAEVSDLKEGLDSVEERARSELGMIAEDESFYMLVEKESRESIESNKNKNPDSGND